MFSTKIRASPKTRRAATSPTVRNAAYGRLVGRRAFLAWSAAALGAVYASSAPAGPLAGRVDSLRLFLCGDVMTGRGIDQILPHPSDPRLHESSVQDAREYVRLAEERNGRIPRGVSVEYVWGDALGELARVAPDVRIVNLETSVTRSEHRMPKGINYRMHPDNVGCLVRAHIDCCMLANNHVLDFGKEGLVETLRTLHRAGLRTAGAGLDATQARAAAVLPTRSGKRVLAVGIGFESSGIPPGWAASEHEPGVNLVDEPSAEAADRIGAELARIRQPSDLIVASVHWGSNWGFEIPESQRTFARALVDRARVDVVHGHSSHHPKGIEVYRGKLILYGCGDFLNDYEGIPGYERYRNDLTLMYFASVEPGSGALSSLRMTPMRIRRFRLERASEPDAHWLRDTLDRACARLGTRVDLEPDGMLTLGWA